MLIESHIPDNARAAIRSTWRRWHLQDVVERIWSGDPTAFSLRGLPELADRLGWLTLHDDMQKKVPVFTSLADDLASDGIATVVLLGMGGSSLAPEVFAGVFGSAPGRPRLLVLDSTHPDAIAAVAADLDIDSAAFIVSSKSGSTLETLSLFRYFYDTTGGDGSRFIAITDPDSGLQALAQERQFRSVVLAPSNVGGRYSALSPFGLVPAAIIGVDVMALLEHTSNFAARSRHPAEAALDLGATWGTLALLGRDKLTVHTSPALAGFPAWLEQLVAESLGKNGTGVVPVAGEEWRSDHGPDRSFLTYRMQGEGAVIPWDDAVAAGHPVTRIELESPLMLGAEMLRAELATAAAGEVLGVHPFDQPDVEAAKRMARQAMMGGALPADALPAEVARPELERLLDQTAPGDYLGIQAFFPGHAEALAQFRSAVGGRAGIATTLGIGPRFLHSTGQLHKGGPDSGVFIQLVDRPTTHVAVPETDTEFGTIIAAQASGDYQALLAAGRRVIRIDLGEDPAAALSSLGTL